MKFLIVLIFSFSYLQTLSQFQFLSVLGQSRSTRNYNNKKEKVISQREIENHISPWNSGTITLSEKKEMVGLIQYNSLEDILIFHNENESKTFNPSNLLRFEYWDSVNNEQKFFQTLPYTDSQGKTQYAFFEILKELDDFAVVSKLKFTDFNVNRVYDPLSNAPIYIGKKTKTTYNEVIYIVNMQGDITPYIGITYKEKNGVFTSTSQTKNKILDEDLLRKQIGILYKQLEDYAAANKLKFEYKPDLINLLNYYSDIIKEKK